VPSDTATHSIGGGGVVVVGVVTYLHPRSPTDAFRKTVRVTRGRTFSKRVKRRKKRTFVRTTDGRTALGVFGCTCVVFESFSARLYSSYSDYKTRSVRWIKWVRFAKSVSQFLRYEYVRVARFFSSTAYHAFPAYTAVFKRVGPKLFVLVKNTRRPSVGTLGLDFIKVHTGRRRRFLRRLDRYNNVTA